MDIVNNSKEYLQKFMDIYLPLRAINPFLSSKFYTQLPLTCQAQSNKILGTFKAIPTWCEVCAGAPGSLQFYYLGWS